MYNFFADYLNARKYKYKEFYSLSATSSIRIGGVARIAVWPRNIGDMRELILALARTELQYRVVGGLTNTLFASDLYDGVVIFTSYLNRVERCGEYFEAECGASLARILSYAKENGFGGAEGLWHIPGSIGAACRGNSGAFGVEIADIFVSGDFLTPSGSELLLHRDDMRFSYRFSRMKEEELFLVRVRLSLTKREPSDILTDLEKVKRRRAASQPLGALSLGSVFKRALGNSAGYYVERAGLKGASVGDAEVSTKHAGFIVNRGKASAEDFLSLVSLIQRRVFLRFGIMLETEIEIVR